MGYINSQIGGTNQTMSENVKEGPPGPGGPPGPEGPPGPKGDKHDGRLLSKMLPQTWRGHVTTRRQASVLLALEYI